MFKKVFFILATFILALVSSFSLAVPKADASAIKGVINHAPTNPVYNYDLISQSQYPSTLEPGSTTNVWIEVKNTGNQVWKNTGSNTVRLGSGSSYGNISQTRDYTSEFANTDWLSANRPSAISSDTVAPEETTKFQFNIKAPLAPGVYKAYFTPVVDGYAWMKDIGIYWQITVKDSTGVSPLEKNLSQINGTNNSQIIYQTNELANNFAPSVVKIICKASVNYWNQGSGTLFHNTNGNPAFPEYYIMTNLHVVEADDDSISKCDIKITPDYKNKNSYFVFESEGYKSYDGFDFAILEPRINLRRNNAGSLAELAHYAKEDSEVTKRDPKREYIGERMLVFGYPENGDFYISEGNIVGSEFYQGSKYIDTSAYLRHGNSGGLAVNSYGQILGIPTYIKANNLGMILDMDYLMGRVIN